MPARCSVAIAHAAIPDDASPDERDVLDQVSVVAEALRRLGHRVHVLPVTLDLASARAELLRRRPDLVFNLVESLAGHGSLIHLATSLFQAMRLACTGCPGDAVYLTSNKLLAKRLLTAGGIATPAPWDGSAGADRRYIVKSVWEHASIGLDRHSVVPGMQVPARMRERQARFGGEWFAEHYVEGREFNIAILGGPDGPQVLPIAEMCFDHYPADRPRIVDYEAKWESGSFAYRHTRRRFVADTELSRRLGALALDCWACFGLSGYARVDVRLDADGTPWVLEVNTNPCLSPDAGFAAALEAAGLDLVAAVDRIVAEALAQRRPEAGAAA